MLLSNVAPQFGIFNGAICKFKGLLYLPDDVNVKLKSQDLKKLKITDLVVQEPFDLRGGNNFSRLHQLPKGTVLVSINNQPVSCEHDLKRLSIREYLLNVSFNCQELLRHYPIFWWLKVKNIEKEEAPIFLDLWERKV